MARIGRKNTQENESVSGEVEEVVTPETEAAPETIEDEESDDFADFLKSGELEIPEQGNSNQEDTEMSKTDVAETSEVEAPVEETSNLAEELNLGEMAQRAIEDANPKVVEMKEIESIPAHLPHIKMNLQGIEALGKLIREKTAAYHAGTSGTDAKVKYAIENMAPTDENFARREEIAAMKIQLAELVEKIDESEAALYENVENSLKAAGEDVWSEEKVKTEEEFLKSLHTNYASMYKNHAEVMEAHNKAFPGDNLGTIQQYVSKVEKPFAKAGKSEGSSSGGGTGSRNVFISLAEISTDGVNFSKVENGKGQSSVAILAAELAKKAKESQATLRENIYSAYYAESGHTFETASNDNMPPVSAFKFNYQDKESGEFKDITVRLTKRNFAR